MTERMPVTSGDLQTAAGLCVDSIRKLDPELWDRLAYGLEWTRSHTVAHICDALDFYAGDLATKVQENPGSRGLKYAEGSIEAAAGQLEYTSTVLGIVADEAPPGTRAFHQTGTPDAEGFLAMGCVEILLHGYDAVAGTEAEFDPDDQLCTRILNRLFPWAPESQFGWRTLQWATGRGEIDGQEFLGESWVWHNDLLTEWEGALPRLDRS